MKKKYVIPLILLALFIFIMINVILGNTTSIDNYVYNLIANNINDTKTTIFKIITVLGSTKFMISLCIFFLILFCILKRKYLGINIVIGLITSTIVNNVIKVIICRERPDVVKLVHESTYSFPSGHTMASTMMYGILIYYVYRSNLNKYLKVLFISLLSLLILLIMISRIYLGAHYVTDVVGGLLLSLFILIALINIKQKNRN